MKGQGHSLLNWNLAVICTLPSCHSERSEESRSFPFCPGIKDEILRHFVPQNDSGELSAKLQFSGVPVVRSEIIFLHQVGARVAAAPRRKL